MFNWLTSVWCIRPCLCVIRIIITCFTHTKIHDRIDRLHKIILIICLCVSVFNIDETAACHVLTRQITLTRQQTGKCLGRNFRMASATRLSMEHFGRTSSNNNNNIQIFEFDFSMSSLDVRAQLGILRRKCGPPPHGAHLIRWHECVSLRVGHLCSFIRVIRSTKCTTQNRTFFYSGSEMLA